MRHLVCIIAGYLFSVTLFAQSSGASPPGNDRASKAKLSAQITLDGYYQTGNTDKMNLSGTVFVSAIDSVKEFSANGKFLYGENNKMINQREYNAGIQYDYHPLADFSPFVRFEFYSNEFKKITGRYAGLVGAKYRYYVKPDISDFSISAAFLFDMEHYTADANLPNKERWRLSIRPKFKQNLTETVYLVAEIYYKPNLKDFNDYIIYGISNLNIRIFKKGLLRLSYEHEYNNRPATNKVKKTDALLLAGIGIELN